MHNIHLFGDADSDCPRGGGVPESEESTGKKKSNYQQRRFHVDNRSEKNVKVIGPNNNDKGAVVRLVASTK